MLTIHLEFFAYEIPEAICRLRALEIFNQPHVSCYDACNEFLKKYVTYRAFADGKKKDNLSNRLNCILERLIGHESCSREQYGQLLEKLATAAILYYKESDAVLSALDNTRADEERKMLPPKTFEYDCLNAAALLGIPAMFDSIVAYALKNRSVDEISGCYEHVFLDCPLANAALGGHYLLVKKILDARREAGQPGYKLGRFIDAMKYAICGGHEHIVRVLLQQRATYTIPNLAFIKFCTQALMNRQMSIFNILSDYNAKGCYHPITKCTHVLYVAASNDCAEVVQNYVNETSDAFIEFAGKHGSPLAAAAFNGHVEVMRILLSKRPAWANLAAFNYKHPLRMAAKNGQLHAVQMLLANHSVPDPSRSFSPLVAAAEKGHAHVVEYLLQSGCLDIANGHRGAAESALSAAAMYGFESVVRLLVQYGVDVNHNGGDPIIQATWNKQHEVVRLLLSLGAESFEAVLEKRQNQLISWQHFVGFMQPQPCLIPVRSSVSE